MNIGLMISLLGLMVSANPTPAGMSPCQKLGGNLSIHTEFKLCSLGKAQIEESSLERHILKKEPQDALRLFLERPMPRNLMTGDAPGEYCSQLGGSTDILKNKKEEIFFCLFGDGSSIEQWTLFKGPKHADNVGLVKALSSSAPKAKK